jgi:transposase
MSYGSATVLGRVERRRRFSVEQKLAVVAEASAPGANISEIARRHEVLPAQVFKWRRLAELGVIGIPGASELPSFVAVESPRKPSRCRRRSPRRRSRQGPDAVAGGRAG